jgi:hypothetical protein
MQAPTAGNGRVVVRQITDADHAELAAFLARGFGYEANFFLSLFEKLRRHDTPPGYPKYGYLLHNGARIVGSVLLIFSRIEEADRSFIRCHVTSWFIEPEYRPLAALFYARGLKNKEVSYINVSARSWTIPIIESQGFRKYSKGQFVTTTLLNAFMAPGEADAIAVDGAISVQGQCSEFERRVVADHGRYGCIIVWCVSGGHAYPFVFHERAFKGFIPGVQLVYCRNIDTFVRFARPLSRFLLARGKLLVRIDANDPIEGLIGKYLDDMEPRFFKGAPPRLGDLAYTQTVMCPFVRLGARGSAPSA